MRFKALLTPQLCIEYFFSNEYSFSRYVNNDPALWPEPLTQMPFFIILIKGFMYITIILLLIGFVLLILPCQWGHEGGMIINFTIYISFIFEMLQAKNGSDCVGCF